MDSLTEFANQRLASTQSISDELASILAAKIYAGDYVDNYVFPNELELCKQLGIGRNSLREAYKILEQNGFVTRTKRGTFVNDRETLLKKMPLSLALRLANDKEMLEHRIVVEGGIVEFAAKRATKENIQNMKEFIEKMAENEHNPKERLRYDYLFHYEIAKAGHNDLFLASMASVEAFVLSETRFEQNKQRIINNTKNAVNFHKNILTAIEAGDAVKAREAMLAHLCNYQLYFSDLHADDQQPVPPSAFQF